MLPVLSPAAAAMPPRLAPAGPSRATSAAAASSSRRRVRSPFEPPSAVPSTLLPRSVDPAIVAAPVRLAQPALHHLAGGRARQRVQHVDPGRALEVGQPVAGERDQP